jgi:hypothetical protein
MQSTCRLYFFLATAAAAAANTKAPEPPPGAHLLGRLDGDNRHDATSSTSTSTSTHYTVVVQYSASTGIETSTVVV